MSWHRRDNAGHRAVIAFARLMTDGPVRKIRTQVWNGNAKVSFYSSEVTASQSRTLTLDGAFVALRFYSAAVNDSLERCTMKQVSRFKR